MYEDDNDYLAELPMSEIFADQDFNCRGPIAPIDVVELANSIKSEGLLQPVIVSEMTESEMEIHIGYKYKLLAGFRRHRAHMVIPLDTIKCVVKPPVDSLRARIINLTENLNRQDLNILQEANALEKMMLEGLTEVQTAEQLGKTRGWVQVRFMLLKLPVEIREEAGAGFLTQSQIRSLYTIKQKHGIKECMVAAKEFKEAKARGRTITQSKKVGKAKSQKKVRSRPEIFEMQEYIFDQIGNNLATRALAWAAGEISDAELHITVSQWAMENVERVYRIPEFE
jgi:ParB family chromosome partitioning protein